MPNPYGRPKGPPRKRLGTISILDETYEWLHEQASAKGYDSVTTYLRVDLDRKAAVARKRKAKQ